VPAEARSDTDAMSRGELTVAGYVGVTDEGWYRFLAARQGLDEVNFWRPKDPREFAAVPPGSPFLFKLKAPRNAIVGFAWFVRFAKLPLSLVWETFREKNGVPDLPSMRARIAKLRRSPIEVGEDPDVGCILLTQPVFFPESEWIAQPTDFSPTLVQGRSYDLATGEGARLWQACRLRAAATQQVADIAGARFGAPALVRPRLGQGTFRVSVIEAYDRACAVSGEHSLPVLEAAHIRPYAAEGPHEVRNGLLLRTDIHRLYDAGYVTVTPDLEFRVSPRLRQRWENGRAYYALEGQLKHLPRRPDERPDPELLDWHSRRVFVA
jgi:putative restriction endonuclease